MSLVTPDFGLIFWMTLIFGIVLFLLWKFGFPTITDMVEKRARRINDSLQMAAEAELRLQHLAEEQDALIEKARKEQAAILKEATETKNKIIADAKEQAREEAEKLLSDARIQMAAEKESALRDIRKEVALLSVSVAEKILRKDLSGDLEQQQYMEKMVDETIQAQHRS